MNDSEKDRKPDTIDLKVNTQFMTQNYSNWCCCFVCCKSSSSSDFTFVLKLTKSSLFPQLTILFCCSQLHKLWMRLSPQMCLRSQRLVKTIHWNLIVSTMMSKLALITFSSVLNVAAEFPWRVDLMRRVAWPCMAWWVCDMLFILSTDVLRGIVELASIMDTECWKEASSYMNKIAWIQSKFV